MHYFKSVFLVTAALLCIATAGAASAKDTVMALSPYGSAATIKTQVHALLTFALEQNPGDRVIVVDGYHLRPIATIALSSDPRYQNPKAQINLNRAAVADLMAFSESAIEPGGLGHPAQPSAIKLPQLLRYVARNHARGVPLDVVVLGSALYDDPSEPAFSMIGGLIPGDGHLKRASRADTPFATGSAEGLLKDLRVHLAFNDKVLRNDRIHHFVQRFWTLLVERQGGSLMSFESSSRAAFDRVTNNAPASAHRYRLEETDKLEMIAIRPAQVERPPIFERPISASRLTPGQIKRAHQVEIGISWDCTACDLDLYSMPFPGAPVLYFGNRETPQGRYWKDYTTSPNVVEGFETIAYRVPVNLRELVVAVNFYGGQAPEGVNGELRLAVAGQTFSAAFYIQARAGHGSRGMDEALRTLRSQNDQTLIIDVLSIVTPKAR